MREIRKITALLLSILMLVSLCSPALAEEGAEKPARKPFVQMKLPGEVLACNYDEGGKGVAYYTLATESSGYEYRPGELMKFYQSVPLGGVIVSFNSNQWMEYTVEASYSGWYDLVINYGTENVSTVLDISVDGTKVLSPELKETGGWTTSKTLHIGSLELTKGKHVFRIAVQEGGGLNFRSIKFYKKATTNGTFTKSDGAYKKHVIPTEILAENYDSGADGSVAITPYVEKEIYRESNGIEIKEAKPGEYSVILKNHESLNYTVEVKNDGVYSLYLLSTASGRVEISYDGGETLAEVVVRANQEAAAGACYLTKGTHILTVKSTLTNLALEKLRFVEGDSVADVFTEEVTEPAQNYREFFVALNGSDENDGSFEKPFASLERARDAAREISNDMTGDIIINIMPGFYQREETFLLGLEDGGKNGYDIVYKGYNALETPILSGGRKVTEWTEGANGIWQAHLPDIDDMRQLYVNGALAQRAQSKYQYIATGYYDDPETEYPEDGFVFNRANFPVFSKPENAEMVSNLLWTSQRTAIKDVIYKEDEVIVLFDQPYFYWQRTKSNETTNPTPGMSCNFENSLDFLDEAGEFYFDKDTHMLYYKPYAEEDLTTAECFVGKLEFMLKVDGESYDNKVSHLRFENIDFRHGTWLEPNTVGYSTFQADSIVSGPNQTSREFAMFPGQLHFNYADSITVKNCRFINLGSSALVFEKGVTNVKVEGNLIRDIAGGGITVGTFALKEGTPVEETAQFFDITNNVLHRTGQEYMSTCGISIYFAQFVNVFHNDIRDLPYTGVTIGWGWVVANGTDVTNIDVSYNNIFNVSRAVRDGGQIYGVGGKSNISLSHNHLVSSEDYGGIYQDSGSCRLKIFSNVVEECINWLFEPNYTNFGSVVYDNYSDADNANFLERYSLYGPRNDYEPATVKGENGWQPEALKIIDEAGVEPNYRYLLNGIAYPSWRKLRVEDTVTKTYSSPKLTTIWAKDYMEGGEGVAYHKNQEGAEPKLYQQQTKFVVGGTSHGEWLKYTFTSPKTQSYDIELCCANASGGGDGSGTTPKANVYIDDVLYWEKIDIPDTGSWTAHVPFVAGHTELTEGEHTIKVEFVDNGFSFERIDIKAEGADKTDVEFDDGAKQY